MINYAIAPNTSASYPAMVAAFSTSILSINQAGVTLVSASVAVGSIWYEAREAYSDASSAHIKFDLQAIARAYFSRRDMFGDLTIQSSNDRRSAIIQFDFSVIYEAGTPPATFSLSIPCFFGAYLVGEAIHDRYEHVYLYTQEGATLMPQFVNLPLDKYTGDVYKVQRGSTGADLLSIDPRVTPMYDLASFDQFDDVVVYCPGAQDMDSQCDSVWGKTTIVIHKRESCGDFFRYINKRGLIRYVSMRTVTDTYKTKTLQGLKFDLYEQPIAREGSYIDARLRLSTTTREKKYKATAVSEEFLPLFKGFTESAYVQMATYSDDGSVVTWRNVTVRDTSITRKRKENLIDVSVAVIIDTPNNPY